MTHEHETDRLDALFRDAASDTPSPDLTARVLADAQAVQDARRVAATPLRAGLWARLIADLGGWSAVSGITAAGVMGLAVGLYAPDTVADFLENDTVSFGIETYDLAPDVGGLWAEDGDV